MVLPHELENSVTGQLADLVLGIDATFVSADDLTKAETCLLDWCAVALAALDDPIMALMRDQAASEGGNPQALARVLFRAYFLPFEITSVLLLTAAVGAVVLAKRKL